MKITRLSPQERAVRQDLRQDNPTLARFVDSAHVGTELFLHHTEPGPLHVAGGVMSAAVSASALAWGIEKLSNGQTVVDKVEGVGALALAGEAAAAAVGGLRGNAEMVEHVTLPLALLHCGSEVVVGGADLVRGVREGSRLRQAAGLCQMATGAGLLAAHLAPGAAPVLHAGVVVALAARQALLGWGSAE